SRFGRVSSTLVCGVDRVADHRALDYASADLPQIDQRDQRAALLGERCEPYELTAAICRFGLLAFAAVITEGVERRNARRLPRIEVRAVALVVVEDLLGVLRPIRLDAEPFG